MTITSSQLLESLTAILSTELELRQQSMMTVAEFLVAAANGHVCTDDPQKKTIRVTGQEIPTIDGRGQREVSYVINRLISALAATTAGVRERAVFALGCLLACLVKHELIKPAIVLPKIYLAIAGFLTGPSTGYEEFRAQRLGFLCGARVIVELGGMEDEEIIKALVKDNLHLLEDSQFAKCGGELAADLLARLVSASWSRSATLAALNGHLDLKEVFDTNKHSDCLVSKVSLMLRLYQIHEKVNLGPLTPLMNKLTSEKDKFINKAVQLGVSISLKTNVQLPSFWPLLFNHAINLDALPTLVDAVSQNVDNRKEATMLAIKLSAWFLMWARVLVESKATKKPVDLNKVFETVFGNTRLRQLWMTSVMQTKCASHLLADLYFREVLDMVAGTTDTACLAWRKKLESVLPGEKKRKRKSANFEMPSDCLDLSPLGTMAILEHVGAGPVLSQSALSIYQKTFQTPLELKPATQSTILKLLCETVNADSLIERVTGVFGPSAISDSLVRQALSAKTSAELLRSYKVISSVADRTKDTSPEYVLATLLGLTMAIRGTAIEVPKELKSFIPTKGALTISVDEGNRVRGLFNEYVNRLRGQLTYHANNKSLDKVSTLVLSVVSKLNSSSDSSSLLSLPLELYVLGHNLFVPAEMKEDPICVEVFDKFKAQFVKVSELATIADSLSATELTSRLASLTIDTAAGVEATAGLSTGSVEDQARRSRAWDFLKQFKAPVFLAHSVIDIVLDSVIGQADESAFVALWKVVMDEDDDEEEDTTAVSSPKQEDESSEEEEEDSESEDSDIAEDALKSALDALCAEAKIPEGAGEDIVIDTAADFVNILMADEERPPDFHQMASSAEARMISLKNSRRLRGLKLVERRLLACLNRVSSEADKVEQVQAALLRVCDLWHLFSIAVADPKPAQKKQQQATPPGWLRKLEDFSGTVLQKAKAVGQTTFADELSNVEDHFRNTLTVYATAVDTINEMLGAARKGLNQFKRLWRQVGAFADVLDAVSANVLTSHPAITVASARQMIGSEDDLTELFVISVHPHLDAHPRGVRCSKCASRNRSRANACKHLRLNEALVFASILRELKSGDLKKTQVNELLRGVVTSSPRSVSASLGHVMLTRTTEDLGLYREILGILDGHTFVNDDDEKNNN